MPLSSSSKTIPSQGEGQHSCPDLSGLHDVALGLESVFICDSKPIFFFFLFLSSSHKILLPIPWSHHAHHLLWSLFLFFFSPLDNSRFTMLCYFQVSSKMNQLYRYIYLLFAFCLFEIISHIGHDRVLSWVPCAIGQVLISYLLYIQ